MKAYHSWRGAVGWTLLLAATVVPLFGCGPEIQADRSTAGEASVSGEAVGPRELTSFEPGLRLSEPWFGDLDGMVERRHVRALVAYSKTHYFLDGATQRGLAYEGLTEFEGFLNRRLGSTTLKIHVVIVPVRRDELLPALDRGLGDLAAANLTITSERLEVVDFGRPFSSEVRELVITGPSGPTLTALEDLSGKPVYLRRQSSYWSSLEALNQRLVESGVAPAELVEVEGYLEDEDLLEMVGSGLLPTTVVDDHLARFWGGVLDGLVVHDDLAVREGGEIAWAVRRGCPELKTAIDDFAASHQAGSMTTNVLLERYLKSNPWVRNPLADADRRRFDTTFRFFEKYAAEYRFDALLLTAMAYQESRLDHATRSRAGAVGIMQIKPETAADPNVGIPDIASLENNIHAGTKYLRFLRDRYFSDPSVDDFNQTLFTFAAYNAGPARVRQLREDAAERGLDPNVWFGNVEVAAARRVGRETVQYVGNIAKYYVAYRLAARQQKDTRATDAVAGGGTVGG